MKPSEFIGKLNTEYPLNTEAAFGSADSIRELVRTEIELLLQKGGAERDMTSQDIDRICINIDQLLHSTFGPLMEQPANGGNMFVQIRDESVAMVRTVFAQETSHGGAA